MTSFATKNYISKNYNSFRPHYPSSFYKTLLNYHDGRTKNLIDIGCGTGVASFPLLQYFDNVTGTDASPKMIETANNLISEIDAKDQSRIQFKVSKAESLPFINANSVDMVTAAQCIHWFNHDDFFKECHRILKPGGTLAYWFYIDPVIHNQKIANGIVDKYLYTDPRYMGPKWEQPGRNILRNFLDDVNPPSDLFNNRVTNNFKVTSQLNDSFKNPLYLAKTCPLSSFKNYIATSSSYHTWKNDNPNSEDAVDLMINEIKSTLGWEDFTEIDVIWNTGYTFVKKIDN